MIGISTIIMFGPMYLNIYPFDHVFFTEIRACMALVMGAMAVIMIFRWTRYENKKVNMGIVIGSIVIFAASLWFVKSQKSSR